ncbi:DUF421 domain-containing protein [Metallumcola ferriviriculae]|uniref:DUF421 domain-containing protein n=1 Tax=Metallumcola ferriviriculae TaxID=3039180 RepID=A0AAU0ULW6_9FIRM|nr:DUF421 domain-containing protein [Desulfitibacteraceae bacterium MK1]
MIYLMIAVKSMALYLIGIAIMRLLGKSTIVQMTPYDLLAIIIIGTVVSEPLISENFLPTIFALAILTALHIIFSKLTLASIGKSLFLGEPTLLIQDGRIIEDNLEKTSISVSQLLSILRSKGYPKVSDVDYAVLEPIGELSIVPKVENTPVTVGHLGISIKDSGLPIAVVVDGQVQRKNLELVSKSEQWLKQQLRKKSIKLQDIIYAFVAEKSKELEIFSRQGVHYGTVKTTPPAMIPVKPLKSLYAFFRRIRI